MKKSFKLMVAGVALAASLTFMGGMSIDILAVSTTVTAGTCNVRSEASTDSEAVFSVTKGQKLEVVGSTAAADGYTWYKVEDGGKTGYIRADLVETPDGPVDGDTAKPADNGDTAEPAEEAAEPAAVSGSDAVKAVVTADTVTVRSGASTSTSKAGSAKNGQEVNISGESVDSDGYTWYQVSFEDGGKTVSGYIRNDFLQVTETRQEEPVDEAPVEEPVEVVVPEQSQDYECVYEANSDGIEEWFLYDHINGTKQSINNIYAVMKQSQEAAANTSDSASGVLKIIIIIMAVVILALIGVIVFLVLRGRDHYENFNDIDRDDDDGYGYDDEEDFDSNDYNQGVYDDYEDEEEEDDEETYARPKKLGRGAKKKERRAKRGAFDFDDEDDDDDEETYERPTRRGSRSYNTEQEAWSTSGMLDIDDDMEFEFLDLDK